MLTTPRLRRECCLCKSASNTLRRASIVIVPAAEQPRRPWSAAATRSRTGTPTTTTTATSMPSTPRGAHHQQQRAPGSAHAVAAEGEDSSPGARRRRPYHCGTCGRAFRYACNLRAHEVHHARAPAAGYACPDCSASFAHAHQLVEHIRQHEALQQQIQLQEQVARQMEEQMLMQQHLEEQFLIQQAYITQTAFGASLGLGWGAVSPALPAAPTPIRCVCLECGREFLQRSALRQHMREHERKNGRGKKAEMSPRRYRRHHYLGSPTSLWPSSRPSPRPATTTTPFFRCGCGASFDDPQSLHAHRGVHERKKPFHCSQCPADFSNPWNLARHYKEHLRHLCVLSLSDLRCAVCNENFQSDEVELRRHRALHKDVRYCRCARCGTAFRSGWDCETHSATCTAGEDVGGQPPAA